MKIWKVSIEENYGFYMLNDEQDDMYEKYEWDGRYIDEWHPINFQVNRNENKPDMIAYLDVLIATQYKVDLFERELNLSTVQLLPITCNEENENNNLRFLNVLKVDDALKEEECEFDYFEDGRVAGIDKYVFNEEAVRDLGLFKIKHSYARIFATDKFKEIYEKSGLRGLKFVLVWDSKEKNECEVKKVTDEENQQEYINHLEKYLGKVKGIHRQEISLDIPIDVIYIEGEKFNSLVTNGMRCIDMNVPIEMQQYKNIELTMFIDKSYDISEEGLKKEENLWLINLIRNLAVYPSKYNTWLGWGHTAANGADLKTYHKNTDLCAAFIYPPVAQGDVKLYNFKQSNKDVYIYNIMPIYKEEMNFIIENSGDDFFDLMGEQGIDQIVREDRKNICR